MKYTVYLFNVVRIRMEDIEADSQEEAVEKASQDCDVSESLAHGAFEDDEAPFLGALVDEMDANDDVAVSRYHELPGAKLYLAISEDTV